MPETPKKPTIATPEGDNEFAPDQPLTPVPDPIATPPGSKPDVYRQPAPRE
ncbi:hypothetical protein SAMN05421770_10711 [Granulicella rosea]|uniref:Uncharacterized protein n=1 Tax=Granulicella rosea TaxID=474952 RepID=A0A239LG99_9BACT|nr:hypothetical protein [Granulicella rosea]SNT29501.1 hypothetical protein SAMN05421770_10711 [Granulicella rosea]